MPERTAGVSQEQKVNNSNGRGNLTRVARLMVGYTLRDGAQTYESLSERIGTSLVNMRVTRHLLNKKGIIRNMPFLNIRSQKVAEVRVEPISEEEVQLMQSVTIGTRLKSKEERRDEYIGLRELRKSGVDFPLKYNWLLTRRERQLLYLNQSGITNSSDLIKELGVEPTHYYHCKKSLQDKGYTLKIRLKNTLDNRIIEEVLKKGSIISVEDLSEILGTKREYIIAVIRKLQDKGILIPTNLPNANYNRSTKENNGESDQTKDEYDLILSYVQNGRWDGTLGDLAEFLSLSKKQTRILLNEMEQCGFLG